jgi:hypothetical protein
MNALERKRTMNLSTLGTLLLAAALATGCAMQAGQGTDDPGTTAETLTSEQAPAATAAAAGPRQVDPVTKPTLRMIDGKLFWVDGQGQPQGNELRIGPTVDPGAPVQDDGDGREPDPHPWHGGVITR